MHTDILPDICWKNLVCHSLHCHNEWHETQGNERKTFVQQNLRPALMACRTLYRCMILALRKQHAGTTYNILDTPWASSIFIIRAMYSIGNLQEKVPWREKVPFASSNNSCRQMDDPRALCIRFHVEKAAQGTQTLDAANSTLSIGSDSA